MKRHQIVLEITVVLENSEDIYEYIAEKIWHDDAVVQGEVVTVVTKEQE